MPLEDRSFRAVTLQDILAFAFIAALAESLPLDAASHLAILMPGILGNPALSPLWIAVQGGMILAMLTLTWRNWADMGWGLFRLAKGKLEPGARLAGKAALAAMPLSVLAALGLGVDHGLLWRPSPSLSAILLILFGLGLGFADKIGVTVRRVEHMGWLAALGMGLVQGLVLIPGASRLGVMITLGRILGYERQDFLRFGMVVSILILLVQSLAGLVGLSLRAQLIYSGDLLLVAALSFLVSLAGLGLLLRWVQRGGFLPMAAWRVLAGTAGWLLLMLS